MDSNELGNKSWLLTQPIKSDDDDDENTKKEKRKRNYTTQCVDKPFTTADEDLFTYIHTYIQSYKF